MFLKTLAIFALCVAASLPAQVARPTLNGLELRKGQMIKQMQVQAQAQLDKANKELPAAQEAEKGILAQATITPANQKEANAKSAAINQIFNALMRTNVAKSRQAQAQLRVTQLQNQMADWESTTLAVHKADPAKFKVDWSTGQIVGK